MWCQQRPQAALVLHSLCFSPHPHPSDLSGLSCLVLSSGGGEWDVGFWLSHAASRQSRRVAFQSPPSSSIRGGWVFSPLHPHSRFGLLDVLQPCLPGSSLSSGFSLLFTSLEGVPEG